MGLDLEVGILADLLENDEEGYEYFKSQLAALNEPLKQAGLPVHTEPEDCQVWSTGMFGYSGLHYLRRVAAYLNFDGRLHSPGGSDAAKDQVLAGYYQLVDAKPTFMSRLFGKRQDVSRRFDHLILHSDAEGFYLPVEFPKVLFPDDSLEIAGGMVGSSHRLLRECEQIAAALEIPAGLDETSEDLWKAADSQGEGDLKWQRYGMESFSCVSLMRGCMKSIEQGAALVFC